MGTWDCAVTEGTPTERLDWLRAVVRSCGDSAIRVATELEARWNRSTGTCWPSVAVLVKDTLLSERAVQRALAELERAGFIVREFPEAQGRGQATTYFLEWSAGQRGRVTLVAPITDERVSVAAPISSGMVPLATQKGATGGGERVSPVAPQLREENSVKRTLSNAGATPDQNDDQDLFKNLPVVVASPPARIEPVPVPDALRWKYGASTTPWAKQLKNKCRVKIFESNWTVWEAMVEEHGLEVVAAAALRVPVDQRWPEQVEKAIKSDRGQAPIAQATNHRHEEVQL